jgi:Ca2+-binding EF-hand superfamily protein
MEEAACPTSASRRSSVSLSPSEVLHYRQIFDSADHDGDGAITVVELGNLLSSLDQKPTFAELQDLVNEIDSSGDGKIDFAEFVSWASRVVSEDDLEDELFEAFDLFDEAGDGVIDAPKLCKTLANFGEHLTEAQAEMIISEFDNDEDGCLEYCEFREMMTTHKPFSFLRR